MLCIFMTLLWNLLFRSRLQSHTLLYHISTHFANAIFAPTICTHTAAIVTLCAIFLYLFYSTLDTFRLFAILWTVLAIFCRVVYRFILLWIVFCRAQKEILTKIQVTFSLKWKFSRNSIFMCRKKDQDFKLCVGISFYTSLRIMIFFFVVRNFFECEDYVFDFSDSVWKFLWFSIGLKIALFYARFTISNKNHLHNLNCDLKS